MKIMDLFENHNYNNWVRYTPESLGLDFHEYKKKEYIKWESRAHSMGFRFPLFDTLHDFQRVLDQSPIVSIDELHNISNLTKNSSIDDVRGMVNSYIKPRDVDRIIQGYNSHSEIPLPIILQGSHGKFIMAGNTKQDVARIMGIIPRALLVDVSKNKANL